MQDHTCRSYVETPTRTGLPELLAANDLLDPQSRDAGVSVCQISANCQIITRANESRRALTRHPSLEESGISLLHRHFPSLARRVIQAIAARASPTILSLRREYCQAAVAASQRGRTRASRPARLPSLVERSLLTTVTRTAP